MFFPSNLKTGPTKHEVTRTRRKFVILTRVLDLKLGLNEILVSYCVIYLTVITRSKTIFSSVDIPKIYFYRSSLSREHSL